MKEHTSSLWLISSAVMFIYSIIIYIYIYYSVSYFDINTQKRAKLSICYLRLSQKDKRETKLLVMFSSAVAFTEANALSEGRRDTHRQSHYEDRE